MKLIDSAYSASAELTGKSEEELRKMGEQIFGTMLYHAMLRPGETVWTVTAVQDGRLDVEVNVFLKRRKPNGD